ncbi:O-antigen ligase family protein [Candidatus Marithrix sp. Canyon 246]|uniref:O-antigen ligase family protein n=1 Tax=Candidatus Marithrix sp. Canyon 246 TaxID=1827136 RepID=UPI00084A2287|nr:O-antigen ligase family protein [Candidatus Marithrix sp. Canyon 246]
MNLDTTRRILAILIGFAIPISTALTNILCPLALLLLIIEGRYKQNFNILRVHPVAIFALLFVGLMLLGLLYTPVAFTEAGLILDKYREFLYIPIFILFFRDPISRQWGLYAFISAILLTLILSYVMAFTGWEIGKGTDQNPQAPYIFKNYITQSLLLALVAYFIAMQAWQERRWILPRAIVVLLIIYNIMFLSEGRTGYLVLFCLILLFCYQTYRLRGAIIGSIFLVILTVLVYQSSQILKDRLDNISEGVQDYKHSETNTSIKMRLEFNENSLNLITEKPIFGHGTGSFSYEYQKLAQDKQIQTTKNPHNEYLMIGVQWGVIGIALFIALLYIMWLKATMMAQGLIVTIAIGCLFNSFWLDSTEGHVFAYLIGIFYGGIKLTNTKKSIIEMKSYLKSFVLILIFGILSIATVRIFMAPPVTIDSQLAKLMMKIITEQPTRENSVISLDIKGNSFPVETKFETLIKTGKKFSTAETGNISTKIKIAHYHRDRAAHIIIVANYLAPKETQAVFFQRYGNAVWEGLDITKLKPAEYYDKLPETIDLSIYNGPLVAGRFQVYVAYVLTENQRLILNTRPIEFFVE